MIIILRKLKKILENNLQLIFDIDCFETNMKNEAIKGSDRMALLRALQFNIGDILCKTDKDSVEDVKKARQEIANILQDNNIQSGRIKFIINVFSIIFISFSVLFFNLFLIL